MLEKLSGSKMSLPIPIDVVEKLNDGYYLAIDDGTNVTAWRVKDNEIQNKVKHKSGVTEWLTVQYLILPMKAKYIFKKVAEE
jgi:hypothetical protein